MSQTSYVNEQSVSFAGMLADARFNEIISAAAEGAIAFGTGVVAGTDTVNEVKAPANTSGVFRGIAVHHHKMPVSGVARYEDTEMVSILTKGQAWVNCATGAAIALSDTPYMIGSGAEAGYFTSATTGTQAMTGLAFASTYATGSTPAMVRIDINKP